MARKKSKVCYSGVGGQAVLEGVMMKNKDRYAVAVRKPNGEIDVEISNYQGILEESKVKKIPFVRGVFNFVDSLILGMKALNHSADFYEEEEEESKFDKALNKLTKGKGEEVLTTFVMLLSIVLAVGIFIVLPYFISAWLQERYSIMNESIIAVIEGGLRIGIFILYVVAISAMKDIRRVYMYHGAEHKSINCIENGLDLTVENVRTQSRQHKRCGTSFLLFVVFISLIFFLFIRVEQVWLQAVIRVLLVPVIAGVSYEIIRFAGNSDNKVIVAISKPGFALQRLTTREPDDSMIEVAIEAIKLVIPEESGADEW